MATLGPGILVEGNSDSQTAEGLSFGALFSFRVASAVRGRRVCRIARGAERTLHVLAVSSILAPEFVKGDLAQSRPADEVWPAGGST